MGSGGGRVVFVLRMCLLVRLEVLSFQLISIDKKEMTYSLQEKGTIMLSTRILVAPHEKHLPTKQITESAWHSVAISHNHIQANGEQRAGMVQHMIWKM